MVSDTATHTDSTVVPDSVPGASEVAGWITWLTDPDLSDTERLDRIRALEELKDRAAGAQARLTADLDASQRAHHADLRLPSTQRGRGVASLVAAARRESPARGSSHLGLATVLVHEMPHTLAALESGAISEWRATIMARETACLSREDRAEVDTRLMADPATADGWGDRRLGAEAQKIAYALDAHAVVQRLRRAEAERRVSVRPAPDTMSQVSALLPAAQGIAVWATLTSTADSLVSQGDGRSRGQIMADTLVERVTGQATAAAVPVAVNLTISDETLLHAGTTPAWLHGHGPIPAAHARDLTARALDESLATLRHLYVTPGSGELVQMESTSRTFPPALGLFIELRDQVCRTPWCDAPIRHDDHIHDHATGGPTTGANGQGLCAQCNHAKQGPGWTAHHTTRHGTGPPARPPTTHTVVTTLPTGHQLTSTAPALPRPRPHRRARPVADSHPWHTPLLRLDLAM